MKLTQKPAATPPITPRKETTPPAPQKPITSTYRPSFVPPQPQPAVQKPATALKVDVSSVKAGTVVIHKAYGEGTVKEIKEEIGGRVYIYVAFDGETKRFGYPGAFYDGFLSVRGK